MNGRWRVFGAALQLFIHRSPGAREPGSATRFIPLLGMGLGALGGGVYWLSARLWPTSLAVILALGAVSLATARSRSPPVQVFLLLIKYNALMALSTAHMPFHLPAGFTLGLLLIAGQSASRALEVSVMVTGDPAAVQATGIDLAIALGSGFAPAVLLGLPGLVGLAAAIALRLPLTAYALPRLRAGFDKRLDLVQSTTEAAFYLGALASWSYV